MITNYFTLSALAREWAAGLSGSSVRDVYSPSKDELAIEFERDGVIQAARVSVRPGFHFIFRSDRAVRPRSNVATLFSDAAGRTVDSVAMDPTDRILTFDLSGTARIDVHLYGSKANVFLVEIGERGPKIVESFKRSDRYAGEAPPSAKPLPGGDLKTGLMTDESGAPLNVRIARLRPRFGKVLIDEVVFRSQIEPLSASPLTSVDADRVTSAVDAVTKDLDRPSPCIYRVDGGTVFSLIPLTHIAVEPDEVFASIDDGVRSVVLTRIRLRKLDAAQRPLVKSLERALNKARKKLSDLEKAQSSDTRADEYERWAHLLMANPNRLPDSKVLSVADVLAHGDSVEIPVKPELSTIENAERYYAKARNLRTERATIAERVVETKNDLRGLIRLLGELASAENAREVERFEKVNAAELRRYVGARSKGVLAPVPFKRFEISGGFEVWVGRNARENDRLTFDHASPHDLWFHARGVGGSHVVLRVPGRRTVVGGPARREAAAIAAWFSSARGSQLVPVIVTERKYVSKPKGSDPGSVSVLREEVILVEPRLP